MRTIRNWLTALAVLLVTLAAPAQVFSAGGGKVATVSVDVIAPAGADGAVVDGLGRLAAETLVSYRGWGLRRFLAEVDEDGTKQMERDVAAALKRLQEPKPERHVRDVVKALDAIFVVAKERLGELPHEVVARLFRALAMVKLIEGDGELAAKYLHVWMNLLPGDGAQVMRSTREYSGGVEEVSGRRAEAGVSAVTIECDGGVEVTVDGVARGGCPVELKLALGDHLVQGFKEGYERLGVLRNAGQFGDRWRLAMRPLDMLGRYERLMGELSGLYAGGVEPDEETLSKYLASLAQLKGADYQLLLLVTPLEEGLDVVVAFWTKRGLARHREVVARDATFVNRVKGRLLQLCDPVAMDAAAREDRVRGVADELSGWHAELERELELMRSRVSVMEGEWRRIGEPGKADHFAALEADLALLLSDLGKEVGSAGEDLAAKRRALDGIAGRGKSLLEKGRSLLAWNVEAAFAAKRRAESASMVERGRSLVEQSRKLFSDSAKGMERGRRGEIEKRLKLLKAREAGVVKAMKADPEGNLASTRSMLYEWVVMSAELFGWLTRR